MNKFSIIFPFLLTVFFVSCREEIDVAVDDANPLKLTEIRAMIDNGIELTRAATNVPKLTDSIGRYVFMENDRIVFTKIERTASPISDFSYNDVWYDYKGSGETGYWEKYDKQEDIYWTDASNKHTFIGYCLPHSVGNTPEQDGFDWKEKTETGIGVPSTYYGSIGNPANTDEVIDYNLEANSTASPVLIKEDLLLAHNTELRDEEMAARVYFHHALAAIRVSVTLSGFSITEDDAKTKVTALKVLKQPVMYKWRQSSPGVEALGDGDQEVLNTQWTDATKPSWDKKKTLNLWQPHPDGTGSGATKQFVFYGMTVPGEQQSVEMQFTVQYPNPMEPVVNLTKTYKAKLQPTGKNVKFNAGYCTSVTINLNHADEGITVGAEYLPWTFTEIPDNSALKKNETFLESAEKSKVTIAGDTKATKEDATWLYDSGNGVILDIYGHNGDSESSPYTISTADQLLSFAYEVKNGMTFTGKYVKLDADITLQPSMTLPTKTENDKEVLDVSKLVSWIGIGDKDHHFNGMFDGGFRHINKLYGKSFFNTIGENGIVDHIFITDAIEISGSGSIAEVNNGIICGSHVEGNIVDNTQVEYCGSIVGENTGVLIACSHIGSITGKANTLGALLGKNDGILVTCYNVGDATNTLVGKPAYAGVGNFTQRSIAYCCYFNKDFYTSQDYSDLNSKKGHVAFPLTTTEMQSNKYVNEPRVEHTDTEGNVISLSGEITDDDIKEYQTYDPFYYHWSMNAGLRRAVDFLNDTYGKTPDSQGFVYFHAPGATGQESPENQVKLKKDLVKWLIDHFTTEKTPGGEKEFTHQFQFIPGTYPKLQ